jgi:hypothetical protein
MNFIQACLRNRRNYNADDKGKRASRKHGEAESTDAACSVGLIHSSDEVPVMGKERRDQVVRYQPELQLRK